MMIAPTRSALAVLLLVAAAACSQGPADPADAPAVLVTQPGFAPGAKPPCLLHQTARPNTAYEGGSSSRSVPQLTFLAYYTATGTKAFCDGGAASDTDRVWAQLYVKLTGNAKNVTTPLS